MCGAFFFAPLWRGKVFTANRDKRRLRSALGQRIKMPPGRRLQWPGGRSPGAMGVSRRRGEIGFGPRGYEPTTAPESPET